MKIPESIRIGSFDYAVQLVEHPLTSNRAECYGTIDYNAHVIKINKALGDQQTIELSFLHELAHGIIHERNVEVQDEELVAEEIARGLHQVLRDNPEVFR